MKRFKGLVASLMITLLLVGSVSLQWNGLINSEETNGIGGGFTIQQDPVPWDM